MLTFLADENFDGHLVDGLTRRCPDTDLLRVQDIGLQGADDEQVLKWAAESGRVLLTHDVRTMPKYAFARVTAGKPMAGVFVVTGDATRGRIIDDIVLIAQCSTSDEWQDSVTYLPFQD